MTKAFLRVVELSKILGISRQTVTTRMKQGLIPYVQFGSRIKLVPKSFLDRLELDAHDKTNKPTETTTAANTTDLFFPDLETAVIPVAEQLDTTRHLTLQKDPLFLASRERQVLNRAGYKTWGEVADLTSMQLRRIPGAGNTTVKRVKQSLKYLGLGLRSGYPNNKINLVKARAAKAKKKAEAKPRRVITRSSRPIITPTI